ncbi:fumarylacetoacetate hydrolase family protein [Kyrpidia tusciae]|uniref:4-hydroxyphenylacetate degradation bifunctional isomerase/decarboxylase,HpaG2 subunit n=1 Tax=Kyrpidia tusciae (strain DSM 2912 / NBRC 15312 / T2) TaxID=562970 RepID=D5WPM6_KYRT2|nr:fumarylacetoacetate hydrolase family protein [Kyrpidia tusciae]ADG06285.1 4-hydroxyphenylacetate degradation bifunctional isomerase/decarboxylase,HpaG2 subunit [Kyrpidia tusciae DSM 2912]
MKRARFIADGRIHDGEWKDGALWDEAGRDHDPERVVWLPPVQPSKIIGLALNYADHAEELGLEKPPEPVLFFKPPTSLTGHRTPVVYPSGVQFMHYEVELGVVIGRPGRGIPESRALDWVGGYTVVNDVTVRDFIRDMYRPPVRAKGWDTFGPVGPFLVDREEIPDPNDLDLAAYVNGELRQSGHTSKLIYSVQELIAYLSSFMTLQPGDLILTGTPKGISRVEPGDRMRLEIPGVGTLENWVVAEEILQRGEQR